MLSAELSPQRVHILVGKTYVDQEISVSKVTKVKAMVWQYAQSTVGAYELNN